ncbi:hypothetical protein PUMCH_004906 [Australozyma saopauloensis]|uniref:Zn(2)-C6 fungal-type domain-containing protein n=1 Tax=Australozyma saopauloensis TaxID=291208 RepID=A0AAX4HG34_9ASCO|nr:hypothetical protein PUMCH_004906 [[Candida] saopauloensis]
MAHQNKEVQNDGELNTLVGSEEKEYSATPLQIPIMKPPELTISRTGTDDARNNVKFESQLPMLYGLHPSTKPSLTPGSSVYNPPVVHASGSSFAPPILNEYSFTSQTQNQSLMPMYVPQNGIQQRLGEVVDLNNIRLSQTIPSTSSSNERLRRRVTKACERCRTHKIKCSGFAPCQNCLKHSAECNFQDKQSSVEPGFKRQKSENDATLFTSLLNPISNNGKSPAELLVNSEPSCKSNRVVDGSEPVTPSTTHDEEYVRSLEKRVAYLESLIESSTRTSAFIPDAHGITPKTSYFPASIPEDKDRDTYSSVVASDPFFMGKIDVTGLLRKENMKFRVCNKTSVCLTVQFCQLIYENLSKESQAIVECPRAQYYGWNLSGCHYLRPNSIPPYPEMPGFEATHKLDLINYFFREINPLFAVLHEPVFREQLSLFTRLEKEPLEQGNRTALFLAMLLLVYALGIRFTEFVKPNGPDMANLNVETTLFKYAHLVLLIFSLEWESIELVQCWLLAALYLRITHKQCSSNNTLCQAVSMARLMGIGRKLRFRGPDTYEVTKLRRVFYSVFCFDRILGLQSGRFLLLNADDISRKFPLFDFKFESSIDDWLTLPSLAMIHISRLTFYIELYEPGRDSPAKIVEMERDLVNLKLWLDKNGFSDDNLRAAAKRADYESPHGLPSAPMSVSCCAQVRLFYSDLILSIYAKLLILYTAVDAVNFTSVKFDLLWGSMNCVLVTLQSLVEANLIYTPWYLTLSTLVTVGIISSLFINAGKYEHEARKTLRESISILRHLQNSLVYDTDGKIIFRERFKMLDESVWVLKLVNHIMALRHEETLNALKDIGIDHGSSEVNRQTFGHFRAHGEKPLGLDELIEKQDLRVKGEKASSPEERSNAVPHDTSSTNRMPEPESQGVEQPGSSDFGMGELFGNLQWFDQWLGTY